MRLKHLTLQGYKTFATRTEFEFPTGITAIVGPNGSGKSNIADAIRWALGEQSYRTLRGRRTEDMIFHGSDARPRAGMAEVLLTLDNEDGTLPIEFSEVTIGRRAYRDGSNEYLLNGQRVRLQTIVELLSKSGLGRRTYTVIGQGLVDTALSLRPEERRTIFEEAAGITLYRQKREESLRRLAETERNLDRVRDILAEITPRLQRLAREAERANRHQALSAQLDQLLRTWYGYRWHQAQKALRQAQQGVRVLEEQLVQAQEEVRRQEQVLAAVQAQQRLLREDLRRWHQESARLHRQAEAHQRDLAVQNERLRLLTAQREERLSELAPLQAQQQVQQQQIAEAEARLEALAEELSRHQEAIEAARTALARRQQERNALLTARTTAQDRLLRLRAQQDDRRHRREEALQRRQALLAQAEAARAHLRQQQEALAQAQARLAEQEAAHQTLLTQQEALAQQQAAQEATLAALQERIADLEERLARLRADEAALQARREALERLRREMAGYGPGVRALLEAGIPGLRGPIATLIRLPTRWERAVEQALRPELETLVAADWEAARQALAHLQDQPVGPVTLFVLEDEAASVPGGPEGGRRGHQRLTDLIESDDLPRSALEALFGRIHLVANLEEALALRPWLLPNDRCLMPDGTLLRGDGLLVAGQVRGTTGLLAREREWRELPDRQADLQRRRQALERELAEEQQRRREAQEALTHLAHQRRELRQVLAASEKALTAAQREADRLAREVEWQEERLTTVQAEAAHLADQATALEQEAARLDEEIEAAQAEVDQLEEALEALPLDELAQALTQAQTAAAVAEQAYRGQQAVLRSLRKALTRTQEQLAAQERRIARLGEEIGALQEQIVRSRSRQTELREALESLSGKIGPAEAQLADLEAQQAELEAVLRRRRTHQHETESQLSSARVELARRQDGLKRLRTRIEEELGLVELPPLEAENQHTIPLQTPLPIPAIVSPLPRVESLPEGLEEEIRRLRVQIRRLEPVNPNAPQEHADLQARHDFLTEQSADLEKAAGDLRQVIAELDGEMKSAFRRTFQAVAQEFETTFTTLFGGGKARLTLTNPDDPLTSGVEIVARPPGKRQQSLALLSGGERALTAAALIFALLKVSPTPFCVLDEVDAALDEANVGRFRQMLQELAQTTQFIIITHNRGTIEAADTVYGVSMGPDSVSRVLSLRLDGREAEPRRPYQAVTEP